MRVLLATTGDLLREAIQGCLQPEIDFEVLTVSDTVALLDEVMNRPPEVVLLDDLFEPAVWLGDLVIRLKKLSPATEIAILGTFPDGTLIYELFEAGIRGYLFRGDRLRPSLLHALQSIRAGTPYLSSSASSAYLIALQAGQHHPLQQDSEAMRVLRLLANGKNIPEIATLLGVKPRRVYWIQTKLRQRFNVATNEAVISKASQQGYLRSGS